MDEDEAFSRHFAGLVEGGSAGRIGVRAWGPGPSDPDVAAAAARILGAPVPERVTSVRIRGYPAAVALPQMTTHSCGARPRKSLETGSPHGRGGLLCFGTTGAPPYGRRGLHRFGTTEAPPHGRGGLLRFGTTEAPAAGAWGLLRFGITEAPAAWAWEPLSLGTAEAPAA